VISFERIDPEVGIFFFSNYFYFRPFRAVKLLDFEVLFLKSQALLGLKVPSHQLRIA